MDSPSPMLEEHFHLPGVRPMPATQPFTWLRQGWDDMLENPCASLPYGVVAAGGGLMLIEAAAEQPHWLGVVLSGFFLVGPIGACGVYEISRRANMGHKVTFHQSLGGLLRHTEDLLYFGLILMMGLFIWERISAILFALLYKGGGSIPFGLLTQEFITNPDARAFTLAYLGLGSVLAWSVFCISAVSIPMLMERRVDVFTAMVTSVQAVLGNLRCMLLWATLIVVLTSIGFATHMVGMVLIFPLLGHASWRAYEDLVK
ncbi:DUF2189 domain-containing protein [Zoogloea sp.]|uniref:DUF2189 domain-containing protein n=1 Tax=Zoogloea sp. TaxID=49181 RepID=UPI0035B4E434